MLYYVPYYHMRTLCKGFVKALNAEDAMRIVSENLDSSECRVVSAREASEDEITEKSITFNFRHPLAYASSNGRVARDGGGAV